MKRNLSLSIKLKMDKLKTFLVMLTFTGVMTMNGAMAQTYHPSDSALYANGRLTFNMERPAGHPQTRNNDPVEFYAWPGGFRLDDITLSGTKMPSSIDLKITSWNVDWLSCTNPDINQKDRELQINNVVSVIRAMNSDIVALQEVGNLSAPK